MLKVGKALLSEFYVRDTELTEVFFRHLDGDKFGKVLLSVFYVKDTELTEVFFRILGGGKSW